MCSNYTCTNIPNVFAEPNVNITRTFHDVKQAS